MASAPSFEPLFSGPSDPALLRTYLNTLVNELNSFLFWIFGPNLTGTVATTTTNATVGDFVNVLEVNATLIPITVTVPRSRFPGMEVKVVKIDSSTNAVTIQDDTSAFLGSIIFPPVNGVFNSLTAYSNGTSVRLT